MSDVQTAPVTEAPDSNQPISIEIGDQTFTGVGETEESLREGLNLPKPAEEKPTRGRKRIDQLTYEAAEERRNREAAEARAADLETRLKALEQSRKTEPQTPVQPAPQPAQAAPTPQQQVAAAQAPAFTFPVFEHWLTQNPAAAAASDAFEQWQDAKQDARTEWKLRSGQFVSQIELDARIRQSIEADRASRTFVEQINAQRAEARKVHPDFDAVLHSVDDIQFPPDTLRLIADVPNSGLLQYRLAKNRDLAVKIAQMRDLGRVGFELAQLMADPAVASSASTGDPVFVPPPPMQPVGSGSKTTVLSASDLADRGGDDYDSSGFREQLRKERGRR